MWLKADSPGVPYRVLSMTILESRVRLVVVGGPHDGKVLPVQLPFMVGRAAECHLRPASVAVSALHCAIEDRQGRPVVRDLGSTNGTFVNGVRLTCEFPLRDSDELRVGPLRFLVRVYDLFHTQDGDDSAIRLIDEDEEAAAASSSLASADSAVAADAAPTISRDRGDTLS